MNPVSVYLYSHSTSTAGGSSVDQRRLHAMLALRDELLALGGVRLSAAPQEADLQVEIVNLLRLDDGPTAAVDATGRHHDPERRRILVVRIAFDQERLDFVCSDGLGSVSAESQAARRIHTWVGGYRPALTG